MSRPHHPAATGIAQGRDGAFLRVSVGVLFWALSFPVRASLLVDFGTVLPSAEARSTAEWVMTSSDHQGRPFLLIDKTDARLYLIAADGRLHGFSPVLLGAALGDESVPGIGSRPIPAIRPHERTTPAGRFVGEQGYNLEGESLVWLDYDAAVSIHRLRPSPRTSGGRPGWRVLRLKTTASPTDV